jgi:hypothetical protein
MQSNDCTDPLIPMSLLRQAIDRGAAADQLATLIEFHREWERNEARKAFIRAITRFKANPPVVLKSKQVNIPGGVKYSHATLAEVVDAVCATLSQYGLSHRWTIDQSNNNIVVTCVLTHEDGHSEQATMIAAPDDSGRKNNIQQIASAVTYLERYTLLAVTGLAAKDIDDDGLMSSVQVEKITPQQAADLQALAEEVGANLSRFCAYMQIESLEDLPAHEFSRAVRELEKKRKKPSDTDSA